MPTADLAYGVQLDIVCALQVFTYWMIRACPVCRAGSLCQVAGPANEGLV